MLTLTAEDAGGRNIVAIGGGSEVTLVVENAGRPRSLRPGEPVPEEQVAEGGPTTLYLHLGELVEPAALAGMTVSAPGWKAKPVGGRWALTPSEAGKLAADASVRIALAGLQVAGPPRPVTVTVDVYNLGGGDDEALETLVLVQRPPHGADKLKLLFGVTGDASVYVTKRGHTPIVNRLMLHIANPSPDSPIVPPDAPHHEARFTLSFVEATRPGYGALTTHERLGSLAVGIGQLYADRWEVEADAGANPPHWTLKPKDPEILGIRERASVDIDVSNLISELEPGTTQIYLQYSGIPGYDDGYVTCEVEKQAPKAGILSFFSETPERIKQGDHVLLSWRTFAVERVELSYGVGGETQCRSSAKGEIPLTGEHAPRPQPYETTMYHLDAYDGNRKVDARQVTVEVRPLPPEIRSFTRSPDTWVDDTWEPVPIDLRWEVANALRMEIEGHGQVEGDGTTIAIRGAQQFTLHAFGTLGKIASATTPPVRSLQAGLCRTWVAQWQGSGQLNGYWWSLQFFETLNFYGRQGNYTYGGQSGGWVIPDEVRRIPPYGVAMFDWTIADDVVSLHGSLPYLTGTPRLRLEDGALTWLEGAPFPIVPRDRPLVPRS